MDRSSNGSEYVYQALVEAGVEVLIGIPGTQTLPLDRTVVERDEMEYVMARHETAVPHVAWGYYESGGGVAATLTVPGPGETNAMHGLKNAYEDCVPLIHVSADVDPDHYGKKPIHEIEPETYDTVVKRNVIVERAEELPLKVAEGLETALTPPYGPVRLGIPSPILEAEHELPSVSVTGRSHRIDNADRLERAADRLAAADRPVVYLGGGTRRSPDGPERARELIELLNAPVVASLKGKGVFPEDDPRFMGVTGSHLPAGARDVLEHADVVLALGTDFDGVTTANWTVPMGEQLIHVTVDPGEIDSAYECDIPLVMDAGEACATLRSSLERREGDVAGWDGAEIGAAVRREYEANLRSRELLEETSPVRSAALLRTVRESVPRDAIVTTDVGGFRLWAKQTFEAYGPHRYISAGSWAGMGVGLPAAIGAQLANPERDVVCLSGDGGLMMCIHELHTAVEYELPIVLVVSNNSDYGIISKSPKIKTYAQDHQFTWTSPSFCDVARGFGWDVHGVESVAALESALESALSVDRPVLVDVDVDGHEPSATEAAEYRSTIVDAR